MIQHNLEGVLNSKNMKIVNLVIHMMCCCLLVSLLRVVKFNSNISTYASMIFATHPIHTEAVSGIVSRCDLLSCLTFLLGHLLYFKIFGKNNRPISLKLLVLAVIGFLSVLGILFKESAIMIMVRQISFYLLNIIEIFIFSQL